MGLSQSLQLVGFLSIVQALGSGGLSQAQGFGFRFLPCLWVISQLSVFLSGKPGRRSRILIL